MPTVFLLLSYLINPFSGVLYYFYSDGEESEDFWQDFNEGF